MKYKKIDFEFFFSVKFIWVFFVVWFGNYWLKIKINYIIINQLNYRIRKIIFYNFFCKMICCLVNINIIVIELCDF